MTPHIEKIEAAPDHVFIATASGGDGEPPVTFDRTLDLKAADEVERFIWLSNLPEERIDELLLFRNAILNSNDPRSNENYRFGIAHLIQNNIGCARLQEVLDPVGAESFLKSEIERIKENPSVGSAELVAKLQRAVKAKRFTNLYDSLRLHGFGLPLHMMSWAMDDEGKRLVSGVKLFLNKKTPVDDEVIKLKSALQGADNELQALKARPEMVLQDSINELLSSINSISFRLSKLEMLFSPPEPEQLQARPSRAELFNVAYDEKMAAMEVIDKESKRFNAACERARTKAEITKKPLKLPKKNQKLLAAEAIMKKYRKTGG